MSLITQEAFDPLYVPLEGSNLIEASAGTGKTYSIAVLVLRLIVEKGIQLNSLVVWVHGSPKSKCVKNIDTCDSMQDPLNSIT